LTESSISSDQNEKAKALGLTLTTFKEIEELGSQFKMDFVFAGKHNIFISYLIIWLYLYIFIYH
jgi:hypothetical protein